jgi:Spy/CpxP family protein refolding chaperone
MKILPLVLCGALALGPALPVAGLAQQAPEQTQSSPAPHHHHHGGMMRRLFAGVNLTDQQRSQIHKIVQQYRSAHPKGSPRDPQAERTMHQQIMNVLTPQQQAQVRANEQKFRAEHEQRMQNGSSQPLPRTSPNPA